MLTVDTILGNEQWSGEAWPDRNGYSKTSNGFQTETDRDHDHVSKIFTCQALKFSWSVLGKFMFTLYICLPHGYTERMTEEEIIYYP